MNPDIQSLLKSLEEFEKTHESVALELRLSFTELIIDQLKRKGWTQRRLAEEAGMKEPAISRILHGDVNCTFETVGKLVWALGIGVRISETPTKTANSSGRTVKAGNENHLRLVLPERTDGKKEKIEQIHSWAETGEIAIKDRAQA